MPKSCASSADSPNRKPSKMPEIALLVYLLLHHPVGMLPAVYETPLLVLHWGA